MAKKTNSCSYSVAGTHCHSCELIIESEIKKLPGVKSVSASTKDKLVTIEYKKTAPTVSQLNNIFKNNNYVFSDRGSVPEVKTDIFSVLLVSMGIITLYYFIQKSGLFSLFNVSVTTVAPAFFFFGLLAGFSTCAALVGGIVLSLSRRGLSSVISFNLGRLVLFALLGGLLGYFGSFFRLSITASAIIALIVSVIMIILALQMLGLNLANKISLSLPKSITSNLSDDSKFSGKYLPFLMGGLTFFLPCGFTLTAQSLALASSNWLTGALIMFFFALGTFIPLIIIGITGAKSVNHPRSSKYFSQIASILILVFALFNIKSQFVVLNVGATLAGAQSLSAKTTVPVVNGKQLLIMDASSTGYSPNSFVIKAGQLVRWEITDKGTSGCTNAVISRSLFDGPINLVPGTTSVKEFIAPAAPGTYRFSCWMGMISGTVQVVQ